MNGWFDSLASLAGVGTTVLLLASLALLAYGVRHAVRTGAELEYWQLVASRGVDGRQFLDGKKVGYLLGCFGGFWLLIRTTYHANGLSFELFAAWLAFVGGIDVFTTIAKAKYGIGSNGHTQEPKS